MDKAAVYTGDCVNGQGTCTLANGDKYEGSWVNKLYHGQGKYTWSRGDVYEGEWHGGVIQGQGQMRFSSSAHYEGRWFNAEPHGPGTWSWTCGGSWRGCFSKGQPVRGARSTQGASGVAGDNQAVWVLGTRRGLPCVHAPGPSRKERHARSVPPRILQAAELVQMQGEEAALAKVNVLWRKEAARAAMEQRAADRLKRARARVRNDHKASSVQGKSLCICGAKKMNAPCICEGVVGRPSTRASSRASTRSARGCASAMANGAARPSTTRASTRSARNTKRTRRVRGLQGQIVALRAVPRTGASERPAAPSGLRRGSVLGKAPSRATPSSSSPLDCAPQPSLLPVLSSPTPSVRVLSPPTPSVSFSAVVNGTPKKLIARSLAGSPYGSRNASVAGSRAHSRRSSQNGSCPSPSSFPEEIARRLETLPAIYRRSPEVEGRKL